LCQTHQELNTELRNTRDIYKREVDFVILENNEPKQFIEYKLQQRDTNPALRYLKRKFPEVETVQLALYGEKDYVTKDGIHICPAEKYFLSLI